MNSYLQTVIIFQRRYDLSKKNNNPEDVEIINEEEGGRKPPVATKHIILARDVFPNIIPIIPVNQRPFFPKMTVPMVVHDESLKKVIIETSETSTKYVGIILTRNQEHPDKGPDELNEVDLYSVGVLAEIRQIIQVGGDAPVNVLLFLIERFTVRKLMKHNGHLAAEVEYLMETDISDNEQLKAYSLSLIKSIKELISLDPLHKEELSLFMSHSNLSEPGRLADFSAALTTASPEELQDILETFPVPNRLRKALELLHKEIDISKLQTRISKQIESKLSKNQRDFFLREQLKAIKKELGLEKEGKESEIETFEKRMKKLTLPDEAKERIKEEMEKLKLLEQASAEFGVTRTYLDWLTILPWGVFTKDSYDVAKAERILNRDHYGLDDVKQRILEFLSVGMMKGSIAGSILCFVGPPGVGKTSIGQSIARSIGRNFFRFSLGGIRDEAEIKGHRRTYIGALPGKFIQTMKTCKSANPVIMLDEIDKVGASYRGDPASALLEVLDPEQNRDFLDHYLDVRFDLSNVFFICTANQTDTIPRPLLDRMEVIKIAGYILNEKLEIARRHIIPKQLKAHGLEKKHVTITTRALRSIIDGYAREPGVRGLENQIKKILRKSVKKIVEGKVNSTNIDLDNITEYLGKRIFTDDNFYKNPTPGVVMGLAWTAMGGDTLFVESTKVESKKPGFKQTGQLGDVMIESSEIAYTYIRSFLNEHHSGNGFFNENFVHLHVPAGATPKDGPSAGITMASSLYSLAMNKPIRKNFAMTGELSLTGRIMPIGGVKEKTIAAKRAKVRNLIFPEQNRKDLEELPVHITRGMTTHFVESFEDVVRLCF